MISLTCHFLFVCRRIVEWRARITSLQHALSDAQNQLVEQQDLVIHERTSAQGAAVKAKSLQQRVDTLSTFEVIDVCVVRIHYVMLVHSTSTA
jgi:hypothetical protein